MSRHATSRLLTLLTSQPSRQSSSLIPRASFTTVHRSSQSPSPASSASTSASATKPAVPPPQEAHKNTAQVARDLSRASDSQPVRDLTDGLSDPLPVVARDEDSTVDWARSFHGLSSTPFTPEQAAVLQQETPPDDIEIKPDGIIYLPEIKYRRILNKAFGPGGWGLAPRGETIVTPKTVTREYGLVCGGRLVSVSRGEQQYFDPEGIPTATEGCKSNALMRCCKDLGVASELWDPRFIRKFMAEYAKSPIVEHAVTKKRRKMWMRKDDPVQYPFTEVPTTASAPVRTTPSSRNTAPAAKKS